MSKREGLKTFCVLAFALSSLSCPSTYTLGFEGPLPIIRYETEFGEGFPVTIFAPDTMPRTTNAPVIIFNTGWNQPRGSYESYGTQLAQWGYVCVIRFWPGVGVPGLFGNFTELPVEQSMLLLDWLETENQRPASPLSGMVNVNNVGVTGHSTGAAVAPAHASADPRVRAAAGLDSGYAPAESDPEAMLAGTDAAIMYVIAGGGGWCARTGDTSVSLFELTRGPAAKVTISHADHLDFEDSVIGFNYLGQFACPSDPLPPHPQEVRDIATRYMIAWFNVYLKNDRSFTRYYAGPEAQADIDAGLVTIELDVETGRSR